MPERDPLARYGWESGFPEFRDTPARVIRARLADFVREPSPEQLRAWDDSIPQLQTEVREIVDADSGAERYTAILEYELPLDSRRPDVILLVRGAIVVLELKGKQGPSQADLDQTSAYARDLRCYHRSCAERPVFAVVVPTRLTGYAGVQDGVHVAGPDALDDLVQKLQPAWPAEPLRPDEFLSADAYRPLPTLVQAARELFERGELRNIRKARAATDPAVEEISRVIYEAARTRTRRLVLVTGVPGAGKTLVGLRVVHAHELDDLAVSRADGKPTAPAVFLSGNGPLVQVLQYELRSAGGGGRLFVRGVKEYVKRYSARPHLVPPEHVLVFDEAQRAWDEKQVRKKHRDETARSEPEHFIEFAERIPEWCVVVGLLGGGQEIHVGEEGGLVQWRRAIEGCKRPDAWTVHGPRRALDAFAGAAVPVDERASLTLDTEIRFHLASDLHAFVAALLAPAATDEAADLAARLAKSDYHLRVTRDVATAKAYLRERYRENALARFGVLASSRDRDLAAFGVANDWQATRRIRVGPWYADGDDSPFSCRRLEIVVTEFAAQGLELDAVLLAWGTDLLRRGGSWSNALARSYKRGQGPESPFQLRLNSYRVLLTRGRDGAVVFVPPLPMLDETYQHLVACGFKPLDATRTDVLDWSI